jgi:hemolysin activation/secretion protein
MQIEPAQKAGYSNIIIDNEIGDLATLSFTLDNSGNARSGRIKQKFALNQDNFISVNDNIYANYSQSNTGNKSRYSRSLYSSFSMPLGYYTLGASYSYSEYKITTSGVADTIRNFGNTESKNFYVERVLARGQKYKTNLKFDLDLMDTDNYIEDAYQEPSSYNLTVAGISLNNIFYLKKGTLFLQAKYNRGLDKFGAKKDGTGLGDNLPRAQFDSFGLYGQFGRYFNITPNLPLEYKLTFDSLYSKDSLYGQRKIAIGGLYTVRGFNENVISGDKGYYFRNDFKINVGNLVSNIFRGENNGEDGFEKFANATSFKLYNNDFSLMNFLNKTSFGVFYDYGYVRNKVVDDFNDEGYMSGIGAGLTYYHKNFNASLTYSYGLHSPKFLENINLETQDKETIYFSITYNFGL